MDCWTAEYWSVGAFEYWTDESLGPHLLSSISYLPSSIFNPPSSILLPSPSSPTFHFRQTNVLAVQPTCSSVAQADFPPDLFLLHQYKSFTSTHLHNSDVHCTRAGSHIQHARDYLHVRLRAGVSRFVSLCRTRTRIGVSGSRIARTFLCAK